MGIFFVTRAFSNAFPAHTFVCDEDLGFFPLTKQLISEPFLGGGEKKRKISFSLTLPYIN